MSISAEAGGKWTGGGGTGGSMARFMLNGNYLYLIASFHPWRLKTVMSTANSYGGCRQYRYTP
ncbi:MAG: hypothetical protein U5L72_10455 [Bacteroidales bacterium]|nr:hypothetical protein [Bacteroidales bacterium]